MTREEAIKMLKSKMDGTVDTSYEWAETVRMAIEALHKTEWIPCAERLPDKNGSYLVTGRQGAVNKRRFEDGRWRGGWAVIAWMPLPTPWGGDEE